MQAKYFHPHPQSSFELLFNHSYSSSFSPLSFYLFLYSIFLITSCPHCYALVSPVQPLDFSPLHPSDYSPPLTPFLQPSLLLSSLTASFLLPSPPPSFLFHSRLSLFLSLPYNPFLFIRFHPPTPLFTSFTSFCHRHHLLRSVRLLIISFLVVASTWRWRR